MSGMQLVPAWCLHRHPSRIRPDRARGQADFVIATPMRALLFAGALLALALSQPVESSLGQLPTPPVVAMSGEAPDPGTSERPMDEQLFKYALTQGGLTIVCLVLFWWIQREHKRQDAAKDERQQILIGLVEKNTTALVQSTENSARLARAIESTRLLPPGAGV